MGGRYGQDEGSERSIAPMSDAKQLVCADSNSTREKNCQFSQSELPDPSPRYQAWF